MSTAPTTPTRPRQGITHITVRGARQHNLQNVSVSIPRNTLTVVTGLSGSGKSSLAFDTIYAEGQRRYVETLSAYARQFLDQMERPDVDAIDGLSPAISIEQKTTSRSPRSTVGTITEIYDYLRLLWASVGQPHCPNCHRPITRQSAEQIVERIAPARPRRAHHRHGPHRPRPQGRVPRRARSARPAGLPRPHRRRNHRDHRGHAPRKAQEPHRRSHRRPHHPQASPTDAPTTPTPPSPTAKPPPATTPAASKPPSPRPSRWPTASSSSASRTRHPRADRDPLLLHHGLPGLRHQRPQARAPLLLLQLHLRRLPGVPRPRLHLRLRPRQDHHRLVQAPARRRHGPRLRLRLPAQAHQARCRQVQDQPQATLRRASKRPAGPLPLRAAPAKAAAPASTASSPTSAPTWKKPSPTATAST